MKTKSSKDCWDKLQIVAHIFIPIVLAITGYAVNSTLQQKELNVKTMEIAVSILRSQPNDETRAIREWAVIAFLKYAKPEMAEKTKEELKYNALPSSAFEYDPNGNMVFDPNGDRSIGFGAKDYLKRME